MSKSFYAMTGNEKKANSRPEIRKPDPAAVKELVRQRLDRMESEALAAVREARALYDQIREDLKAEEHIRLEAFTEKYGPEAGGLKALFEQAVEEIEESYRLEQEQAFQDLNAVIVNRARELDEEKEAGRLKIRAEQKCMRAWHLFRVEETGRHLWNGLKNIFSKAGTQSPLEAFREGYRRDTGLTPPRCVQKQQVMP